MQFDQTRSILAENPLPPMGLETIGSRAAAMHKEGRSGEAAQLIANALEANEAVEPDLRLTLLRAAVRYAQASHRPDLARSAAASLRAEIDGRPEAVAGLRDELTDALLLEAETAAVARDFSGGIALARRAVELRRDAASGKPAEAKARLIDALASLARHSLATGDALSADASLTEAEGLTPRKLPAGEAWRARSVMLSRIRASLEQGRNRHAEAIAAFEAALRTLPPPKGAAKRDLAATRVQMLVRLGRSRLSLGQAEATAADARVCETLLAGLAGEIPQRAIETIRAAVLANEGAAFAMLGRYAEAEERFGRGLALVADHGAPELEDLRRQMVKGRLEALQALGGSAASSKASTLHHREHEAACGCGHDHDHDHHNNTTTTTTTITAIITTMVKTVRAGRIEFRTATGDRRG